METFIIILLLFLLVSLTHHWRKKLGMAYCAAARYAPTVELRREYSRKAVLAGNKEARKIFPLTIPQEVSDHAPLKVFKWERIPCVFTDYYYPARHNPYLDERQKQFNQYVLDFKDRKHDGILFLKNGIEKLKPKPGTVVLFMPCSTQQKYWKRFKKMAGYVRNECPELVSGISYIRYMGERESLHSQKDRAHAKLERNYFLQEDLAGKEVVLVDDILTTGNSLQNFRKEVEANGGTVTGAVFAAETFKMPGRFCCYLNALCWSEPEKGTQENNMSVPSGTFSDHSGKRIAKQDETDIGKVKNRPEKKYQRSDTDEEPDENDWIPDRTIVHGGKMINLYYGIRGEKRVVVKKEVLPLDSKEGENGEDGLKEFDIRI